MKTAIRFAIPIFIVIVLVTVYYYFRRTNNGSFYSKRLKMAESWIADPNSYPGWKIKALSRCGDAPFLMPVDGYIGFLWDDSFRPGHRHTGLDIFSGTDPGVTSVSAAYSGYLTRLPDWKSTVIIRLPQDPLQPGRQIWTYYTHMADKEGNSLISEAFPPGTKEKFVDASTYLGKVGNYSGSAGNPVWPHLHFSIVKDDGKSNFMNELEIRNSIDPSPYFGLNLNGLENTGDLPVCLPEGSPKHE
jgi:peptidoglycan LD-endopeptidase LytH